MHAFLPPVDVNVTVELGGTDDNPIFVLNLRCMIDNVNLLVTSQKGAIVYATSPLAKMLGYPVKTLTTMQVRSLMPQPYSDLHVGWLKVGAQASNMLASALQMVPTSSCMQVSICVQSTGAMPKLCCASRKRLCNAWQILAN
jgi:hypothetical protein